MLMDTGSTYTHIPREMFDRMNEHMTKSGTNCQRQQNGNKLFWTCKCIPNKPNPKHPKFLLQLEEDVKKAVKFEYGPTEYLMPSFGSSNRNNEQNCEVAI